MFSPSLALVAALLASTPEIAVSPSRADHASAPWQASIGGMDRPGERTAETLKRYDVAWGYRRDPEKALDALERAARKSPEPELVFALAELSWIEGRRLERHRDPRALDRYLDAAAYAFDFLMDPDPALAAGRQPSDPRFLMACHFYNGGIDRLVRAARAGAGGSIRPESTIRLKIHGQEQALRVVLGQSSWAAADIDELMPASDYVVTGTNGRNFQYGLGVPLIAVRRREKGKEAEKAPASDHASPAEAFYPPEMAFPLTAFLTPNSRLREDPADGHRECTLNLVDPLRTPVASRGATSMAVEADLTTPLAYMWSRTDLDRYRWKGLLHPGDAGDRAGLMLLQPYEPGKIPVVMVHGLISSPLAWIPMVDELRRTPTIRARYQFFLYLYPTGAPIPIAAAGLRDAMLRAERTFSPDRSDPAFGRMVLLGHSMGGLLSHAMAVDSGNRLWALSSERPFDTILGPPEVLSELRHYLFFEALPFVRRVVFLATPHGGSEYSRRPVGRISAGLIAEPDHMADLLTQLVRANREGDNLDPRRFRHLPTSIENLRTDSPELKALRTMKPGDTGVRFHSIIGALRPGPAESTTDGVVAYPCAHFDGAESELVIRGDHGVQRVPEAIREVRRILLEHLQAEAAPPAAAPSPVTASAPTPAPAATRR